MYFGGSFTERNESPFPFFPGCGQNVASNPAGLIRSRALHIRSKAASHQNGLKANLPASVTLPHRKIPYWGSLHEKYVMFAILP
jgi:hypothetical protein